MRRPIVVGVDGSPGSLAAARYAAFLALRRDAPLRLLHVFESLFSGYGPLTAAADYANADAQVRKAAAASLDDTAEELRAAHPELTVATEMQDGLVVPTLIAESQEALATVVGSRGTGGFSGLLLGSVSAQVAANGHGTVVVARPILNPSAPVLVGYDGSEAARAALEYGVAEALAQGKPLVVASVFWEEPWDVPGPDSRGKAEQKAERLLAEGLDEYVRAHPKLRAQTRAIHSLNEEHAMTDEANRASLTVVGCRGRGGFAGLVQGSVSQALVNHAACPVAVIHL
jgi:nucleotide-binding universal stress UspA family protein